MHLKKHLHYLFLGISVVLFALAWFANSVWLHIFANIALIMAINTPKNRKENKIEVTTENPKNETQEN